MSVNPQSDIHKELVSIFNTGAVYMYLGGRNVKISTTFIIVSVLRDLWINGGLAFLNVKF